jgi:hypothetical protein
LVGVTIAHKNWHTSAGLGPSQDQRSIVDLQIRRASDVRVEFGQRVTWNVARHELGLSANQPNMALHLPTPVTPTPTVARSLP